MKVLVVGGGGREHALCWAIAASPLLSRLWCAPGNAGIAEVADCVAIDPLDIPGLVGFARDNAVDLVVVGGEPPLVAGLADACAAAGLTCFGPSQARRGWRAQGLHARGGRCRGSARRALAALRQPAAAKAMCASRRAIVVKADGLAAARAWWSPRRGGGGAAMRTSWRRASRASRRDGVIEECLSGRGLLLRAVRRRDRAPLGAAQDHKRVGDGVPARTRRHGRLLPPACLHRCAAHETMARLVNRCGGDGAARRALPRRLFVGLMSPTKGPADRVHVRFGDRMPGADVRLRSDLLPALTRPAGRAGSFDLRWRKLIPWSW